MSAVSVRTPQRRRDIRNAYLLLAPALLLLLTVLAYPLSWEIWTSFTSLSPLQEGATAFVGLENYRRQTEDPLFWKAAGVTVVYAVATSAAKLALGLGFALLLARPFRGRALVFLAIFLPWAYPAGVSVIGWYWTLSPPTTTAYAPFMGQMKYVVDGALRRRRLGFCQRHPVQHLARQLLHRGAAPGRHQRHPARAVRVRGPGIEESVAPLLAGDGAAPQAVPRARGVPLAHQRLRRPRQCLDAHRRPHRLPRHRHPRVLARHQGRAVRARLGAVADAGAVPARGPPRAVPALRSRARKRPHEPEAVVGEARPREPAAARHRLLRLPDLLHARAVAEDRRRRTSSAIRSSS